MYTLNPSLPVEVAVLPPATTTLHFTPSSCILLTKGQALTLKDAEGELLEVVVLSVNFTSGDVVVSPRPEVEV